MRLAAAELDVPVLDPVEINAPAAIDSLRALNAELMIVADYGQILSAEALGVSPLGGINLHASLLPKYRGAAPVNWALYYGETETGVSVIHMTPRLDAGPCLVQCRTAIDPNEDAEELEQRLAQLGAPAVTGILDPLRDGIVQPVTQDPQRASKAPRLKKLDGKIDWNRSAAQIHNQIRAMHPWPLAFTDWSAAGTPPRRLIVRESLVAAAQGVPQAKNAAPGTLLSAPSGEFRVACGEGEIDLVAVQPAGKRVMQSAEFLRGYRLEAGCTLGIDV